MPKIAFIGECMIELSGAHPGNVFGSAMLGFAGDTLNAATYMSRTSCLLDSQPGGVASYVTALGTDAYSQAMIAAWQDDGIETDLVARIDGALPGLYTIQTDATGERSFSYWRDQAAAKRVLDGGHDNAIRKAFPTFDGFYLSGISLAILSPQDRLKMVDLIGDFAKRGGLVYFDTNHRPRLWSDSETAIETYQAIAPFCDTILPTFDDDADLFGDASPQQTAERWQNSGAREVIVKSGGDPTFWCNNDGQSGSVSPPSIPEIVDTTSAGDSFNGAYLAARILGKSAPDAIRIAQTVAGRVICRHGALVDISDLALDQ